MFQPANKKAAPTKSGVNKKADGSAQTKILKPVEIDVEVFFLFRI